jgi:MFS transporter, DHA1 family, inner membrane transport protein
MPNVSQQSEAPAPSRPRIPATAYALTSCVAIIGCNSLVLSPIAPQVAQSLSTSVPAVMTAAAAFGGSTAASALFFARYIDRVGARRMLKLAFAVFVAALVVSAASPTVAVLSAGQLLAGLTAGVALPAIYTLAADIAPQGRESETVGIVLGGWTVSMVAGVSLSALLADFAHWRMVYAAIALLATVAAVGLSSGKPVDALPSEPTPTPLAALSIPGVPRLLLTCAGFMIAFYGVYGYLGDHLHNRLGLSVSASGLVALSYGLGFGAAALLDGAIDRLGARRVLPIALFAIGCLYILFVAAAASFYAVLAIVLVWGLFNHCALNALVIRLAARDPARRGAIMGLNSAVTYLAVFAGTIGFGPVYSSFGFAALPATAAVLTLFVAFAARSNSNDRTDQLGDVVQDPDKLKRLR